jgi:hypothetical protein
MRVVYKRMIHDLIDEEILKAKRAGRDIDHIVLDEGEWNRFVKQVGIGPFNRMVRQSDGSVRYNGVRIMIEGGEEF